LPVDMQCLSGRARLTASVNSFLSYPKLVYSPVLTVTYR
jgi:hypothetical protein